MPPWFCVGYSPSAFSRPPARYQPFLHGQERREEQRQPSVRILLLPEVYERSRRGLPEEPLSL